jgi:uncharacterized protein YciW
VVRWSNRAIVEQTGQIIKRPEIFGGKNLKQLKSLGLISPDMIPYV